MLKKFVIFLTCIEFMAQERFLIKANSECALNAECKHLRECNRVLNNFHLMKDKPYCNLNEFGTYVCCMKPPEKYTQDKDEEIRAVKECKSYQRLRETCAERLIVGGNKTEPQEFPFMAMLIYKTKDVFRPMCGGTLISNKFVLTAAHCIYRSVPPNTVRLGELDWSTDSDIAQPVDIAIKHTVLHPEYLRPQIQGKYNDIALVELANEVVYNEYIMPACLPLVDGRDFNEYLAAGWGYPSDSLKRMTTHMYKVKLDRVDDDTCINKIDREADVLQYGINKRTQMCAGSEKHKRDTCLGDSGGPLFVDHPDYNCLFLIVGVTSFGQGGCGHIGQPGVYTRIQLYLDWIEQIVWKEPASWS